MSLEHTEPDSEMFARAPEGARDTLIRRTLFADYPPGYLFFSPEERTERLLVVHTGRVRLYKLSSEGRSLTLFVLRPFAVFGETALLGDRPHDCFAEALTECRVGSIPSDEVRQLMAQYPDLALQMMDIITRRLRVLETKLADIAFKSVPQRLAAILLSLADAPPLPGNAPPAVLRYTHQQLAEMLGSYRETVTKAIGEFREMGLIRVADDAIYLTNVPRLQVLAGDS